MSITQQHRQEYLSRAYIQAVAAKAGYACARPEPDYGLDLQIRDIDEEYISEKETNYDDYGYVLDVSAKSTYNFKINNNSINYNLDIKAYNNLVRENRGTPAILVLYCMPSDEDNWLLVQEDSTILQHCGYWLSLRGEKPSQNSTKQVVKIPKNQIFCESSLKVIMEKVRNGEYL